MTAVPVWTFCDTRDINRLESVLYTNTQLKTLKGAKLGHFIVKSVVIPATDLTANGVVLFERVKVIIAIALIRMYFGSELYKKINVC